jgi:nucleotide-binding universal stress UspA family protein
MTDPQTPQHKIVVGMDGSAGSQQAVRWAVHQAELTGSEVHAVIAWRVPHTSGWESAIDAVDWAENARKTLDTALEQALAAEDAQRVHRQVIEGHPAKTLIKQGADAELVVVGREGHGGFAGMVLGSVGMHVLAHATCPVVVVHGDRTPRRRRLSVPHSASHVASTADP